MKIKLDGNIPVQVQYMYSVQDSDHQQWKYMTL